MQIGNERTGAVFYDLSITVVKSPVRIIDLDQYMSYGAVVRLSLSCVLLTMSLDVENATRMDFLILAHSRHSKFSEA